MPVSYDRNWALYSRLLTAAIYIGVLYFIFKGRKGRSILPMDFLSQMKRAKFTLVDPLTGSGKGVRFSDVAGLQEAKVEVMELVDYLKRPEHYKALGAKVPKGKVNILKIEVFFKAMCQPDDVTSTIAISLYSYLKE